MPDQKTLVLYFSITKDYLLKVAPAFIIDVLRNQLCGGTSFDAPFLKAYKLEPI